MIYQRRLPVPPHRVAKSFMNNISTAGWSGPNQAVLPLVIGVTGHRDLCQQDVAALEDAVRNCLRELRGICPNTPFVLLSPLAEGADRLVARVLWRKAPSWWRRCRCPEPSTKRNLCTKATRPLPNSPWPSSTAC